MRPWQKKTRTKNNSGRGTTLIEPWCLGLKTQKGKKKDRGGGRAALPKTSLGNQLHRHIVNSAQVLMVTYQTTKNCPWIRRIGNERWIKPTCSSAKKGQNIRETHSEKRKETRNVSKYGQNTSGKLKKKKHEW